jgi:hypothetical protein
MQHLFFKWPSVKKFIKEIEAIFNRSGLTANIEINELNIMLGLFLILSKFMSNQYYPRNVLPT